MAVRAVSYNGMGILLRTDDCQCVLLSQRNKTLESGCYTNDAPFRGGSLYHHCYSSFSKQQRPEFAIFVFVWGYRYLRDDTPRHFRSFYISTFRCLSYYIRCAEQLETKNNFHLCLRGNHRYS